MKFRMTHGDKMFHVCPKDADCGFCAFFKMQNDMLTALNERDEAFALLRLYAKGRESMSMTRRLADQLHERTDALLKRFEDK